MRTSPGRALFAAWLLGAVCVMQPLDARAATTGPSLASQISSIGEEAQVAGASAAKAMAMLARTRRELPAAQQKLMRASAVVDAASSQADAANAALAKVSASITAVRAQQVQVRAKLAQNTVRMNQLARSVYQQGPISELDVLLTATSPSNMVERMASVNFVANAQSQVQKDLYGARAHLTMQGVELQNLQLQSQQFAATATAARAQAVVAQRQASVAMTLVKSLIAQRARAMRAALAHKAQIVSRLNQLRAENARIQAAAAAYARTHSQGAVGIVPSGALDWPIPGGHVNEGVGPRIHPVFGTPSCHTGVDISGVTGTPIHAAVAGTVIDIGHSGPYGNSTLIADAHGMATFYAHQSQVDVHVGQTVTKDQVIGLVGSTGWSTGPHLHFEVHLAGTPYDPLGWFGQLMRPVPC